MDLIKHYEYEEKHNQTPYTPAIPLFYALNQALDDLLKGGVKNRIKKYKKNAELLRRGLKKLGLKFYLPEKYRSNMVAYVLLPKRVKFKQIHDKLKNKGFVIYPGKGPLTEKAMHIATIGAINNKDIQRFLKALKTILPQKK